jgi:hypothetical protein
MRTLSRFFVLTIAALLSTSGTTAQDIEYPDKPGQQFVWNGTGLMPLFSNGHFPCDHWEVWYFAEGDSKLPGYQWGVDSGKSADVVLARQKAAAAFDRQYAKFFNVHYPTDKFTHDKFLGPICVTETALSSAPAFLDKLSQLGDAADRASNLLGKARTFLDSVESDKPGGGVSYLTGDRSAAEEFLNRVHDIPVKIQKTRQTLMANISSPLEQIDGALAAIRLSLNAAEKDVPTPPKPRHDFELCLDANSESKMNCDARGCDTRTVQTLCDAQGASTTRICVLDHNTNASHCSVEPN